MTRRSQVRVLTCGRRGRVLAPLQIGEPRLSKPGFSLRLLTSFQPHYPYNSAVVIASAPRDLKPVDPGFNSWERHFPAYWHRAPARRLSADSSTVDVFGWSIRPAQPFITPGQQGINSDIVSELGRSWVFIGEVRLRRGQCLVRKLHARLGVRRASPAPPMERSSARLQIRLDLLPDEMGNGSLAPPNHSPENSPTSSRSREPAHIDEVRTSSLAAQLSRSRLAS